MPRPRRTPQLSPTAPITPSSQFTPEELEPYRPEPQQEQPSLLCRLGALGARAGSGLIGSLVSAAPGPGTALGAGIGAGGELLAQQIEEPGPLVPNWKKVAAEAAITAAPLGRLFKAGQIGKSALYGAGLGAGTYAARQAAADEDITAGGLVTHGALSGGLSGLLARLTRPATAAAPTFTVGRTVPAVGKAAGESATRAIRGTGEQIAVAPRPEGFVPRSTQIPYGYEAVGGPAGRSAQREIVARTREELRDQKNLAAVEKWLEKTRTAKQKAAEETAAASRIAAAREGMVPEQAVSESISAPIPGGRERLTTRYAPPSEEGEDLIDVSRVLGLGGRGAAPKLPTNVPPPVGAGRARAIYDAWKTQGATEEEAIEQAAKGIAPPTIAPIPTAAPPPTPTARPITPEDVTEAIAEESRASMRVVPPTAPTAEYAFEQEGVGPMFHVRGGPSAGSTVSAQTLEELGIPVPPVPQPPVPALLPETAPEGFTELRNLLRTPRMDIVGQHYRDVQAAAKAGQAPVEGARVAGAALRREAQAAGLPTGRQVKAPVPPTAPITPEVPPVAPTAPEAPQVFPPLRQEQNYEERIRHLDELLNLLKNQPQGPGSEVGAVGARLLPDIAMGLGGAAIGAYTDPLGNPLLSGLAGGIAGVSAAHMPGLLQNIGANTAVVPDLVQKVQTPEGIRESAEKLWQTLPQIQRANYLWGANLPANMLVGPYGSALFGALEKGLAGDPRGWQVMKQMNPVTFTSQWRESFNEAAELLRRGEIGRADITIPDTAGRLATSYLHGPAVYMTAGDLAARKILMNAGFSEDEARLMTLTSEPVSRLGKSLVNMVRTGGPAAQILFPFARTPVNIMEQGLQRTPGIGLLQLLQRDPNVREILVQQGLGAGIGGAGFVAGATLPPETARYTRSYLTNLGGRYSLPASIGLAMGESAQRGQETIPQLLAAGATRGIQGIPLPATDTATDFINTLRRMAEGEVPNLPRGAVPSIVRELVNEAPAAGATRVRRTPRLRRQ